MREFLSGVKCQLALAVVLLGCAIPQTAHAVFLVTPSSLTLLASGRENSSFNFTIPKLYSSTKGGNEGGPAQDSYETAFDNTPNRPADALVTYQGPLKISGSTTYLLVESNDGNGNNVPAAPTPTWYVFNISQWNGLENLSMQDFWPPDGPQGGWIQKVSIYSGNSSSNNAVPEPATISLLVFGVACVAGRRAYKKFASA